MNIIQKTWHQKYREMSSIGDRLADWVAEFVGSWLFVVLHVIWFGAWIIFDIDPFPFGLLTMIVSLEAILLSTFIMMSQNRQSDRDRVQSQEDFQTNRQAKEEIEELGKVMQRIEAEKLDKILEILNK